MIHVHTCASWETIDYAYYLIQNAADMAEDSGQLRFTVYCLDKHTLDFISKSKQFAEFNTLTVNVPNSTQGHGSLQHALALQCMLKNPDDGAHNAILDSDTVLFAVGWDREVERALFTHDVFGAYHEVSAQTRYQGLPTFLWIAFKQGTSTSELDPTPSKEHDLTLDSHELSQLYGLPVGSTLVRETGWRVPSFIREHNLLTCGMTPREPSVVFKPELGFVEYHLNGQPFMAHMGRSVTHPFRMTQRSRQFYDAAERYIETL